MRESTPPCLVPRHTGKAFSLLPSNTILAIGFGGVVLVDSLITFSKFLSIPSVSSVFIMNRHWTLSNVFTPSLHTYQNG